jgi:hypothetical protein
VRKGLASAQVSGRVHALSAARGAEWTAHAEQKAWTRIPRHGPKPDDARTGTEFDALDLAGMLCVTSSVRFAFSRNEISLTSNWAALSGCPVVRAIAQRLRPIPAQ